MVREEGKCVIKSTFYKKSVSSDICIMKSSALPWITKKSALAGEVFRRYYNCSTDIREIEGPRIIDEFCNSLKKSGYNKLERDIIVTEGTNRLRNLMERVENNERPLYRRGDWQKYQRNINKIGKKKLWYRKEVESVVFV